MMKQLFHHLLFPLCAFFSPSSGISSHQVPMHSAHRWVERFCGLQFLDAVCRITLTDERLSRKCVRRSTFWIESDGLPREFQTAVELPPGNHLLGETYSR